MKSAIICLFFLFCSTLNNIEVKVLILCVHCVDMCWSETHQNIFCYVFQHSSEALSSTPKFDFPVNSLWSLACVF